MMNLILSASVLGCLFPLALPRSWCRMRARYPFASYLLLGALTGLGLVASVILSTAATPDFVYVNF